MNSDCVFVSIFYGSEREMRNIWELREETYRDWETNRDGLWLMSDDWLEEWNLVVLDSAFGHFEGYPGVVRGHKRSGKNLAALAKQYSGTSFSNLLLF
jgi:hypothetical protein